MRLYFSLSFSHSLTWAWSEMPTVTVSPSSLAHSWVGAYLTLSATGVERERRGEGRTGVSARARGRRVGGVARAGATRGSEKKNEAPGSRPTAPAPPRSRTPPNHSPGARPGSTSGARVGGRPNAARSPSRHRTLAAVSLPAASPQNRCAVFFFFFLAPPKLTSRHPPGQHAPERVRRGVAGRHRPHGQARAGGEGGGGAAEGHC